MFSNLKEKMFEKKIRNVLPDDFSDIPDEEEYSWGGDSGINIKKLIQQHIDRISQFIFKSNSTPEYSEKGKLLEKKRDSRETVIDAIVFLQSIIRPHYDQNMNEAIKFVYDKLDKLEENFMDSSRNKEALLRARELLFRSKKADKEDAMKAYQFWKEELKKTQTMIYDKDSMEYEYYLTMKHNLMMQIFEELNLLLERKDYLASGTYQE